MSLAYLNLLVCIVVSFPRHTTLLGSNSSVQGMDSFTDGSQVVCHKELSSQTVETLYIFLSAYLRQHSKCVNRLWMMCSDVTPILSQDQMRQEKSRNPLCGIGKFSNYHPHQNGTWRIETFKLFQVNVTFIDFNLRRSYSGCPHHYVKVG